MAAAFMHTEALAAEWRTEQGAMVTEQADVAGALAWTAVRDRAAAPLVRQWSLALGFLYLSHLFLPTAELQFQRARDWFPHDSEMLVALGAVHEVAASRLGQSAPVFRNWSQPAIYHRAKAQAYYEAALRMDSANAEAHLRLGQVLFAAGQDTAAAREYRQALASTPDAWVRYLADLFLGALDESSDARTAEQDYLRAVAAWPGAQTAPLALASLRVRHGMGLAALASLSPRFDGSHQSRLRDPWTDYLFSRQGRFDDLVAAARREACR